MNTKAHSTNPAAVESRIRRTARKQGLEAIQGRDGKWGLAHPDVYEIDPDNGLTASEMLAYLNDEPLCEAGEGEKP